jgi:hypothetical protein
MSSTIDEYKTSGLILINTAQKYIDTDLIQNEIASIDKSWSEYSEYILDTIDYIQLQQEDLREFEQLANHLLILLDEKQRHFETIDNDEIEKLSEQVELLNQKGELLLQNSSIDSNENQVERLLETINRTYDNLTIKIKSRSNNINQISQPITITTNELDHYMNEIDLAMNDLSELLVSSTTDIISAQPVKLTEQLIDNTVVQTELEKRKISLEQLHSNIQIFKQTITNQEDMDLIKG